MGKIQGQLGKSSLMLDKVNVQGAFAFDLCVSRELGEFAVYLSCFRRSKPASI